MLSSLKNLSATLLAIAQTRLSLLGNELEVQKILLVQMLGLLLAMMFCAGLTILFGLGLVVSVWWEQRVLVLGMVTVVLGVVAAGCYLRLQSLLSPAHAVFDASLEALKDDMTLLRTAAQNTMSDHKQMRPSGE